MKIIDKLISDLTSENSSLTDILINSKVLAHKLKNEEFRNWVNCELNGYPDDKLLPKYRIIPCSLIGSVSMRGGILKNVILPIPKRVSEIDDFLTKAKLLHSISTFDDFMRRKTEKKMSLLVPTSVYTYINEELEYGVQVIQAYRNVDISQISEILTNVKSKLLDFLLNLNDAVGDDNEAKLDEPKTKEQVSSIINNTIYGGNPIIVSGNNNTQTFNITSILKGDFNTLEKLLNENGIEKVDTKELSKIIDSDNQNESKHQIGTKVSAWMGKMLGKAANGVWKIAIGGGSELLAHSIMRYYGWE